MIAICPDYPSPGSDEDEADKMATGDTEDEI